MKYLCRLAKKHLVTGLDCDFSGCDDYLCESCAHGKQHRQKFASSSRKTKEPFELVHTDVCGRLETESLNGGLYFLTFIDDFTRYVWIFVLKRKSEVFARFKEWKAMIERLTNRKLKTLRSNNGGE